MVEVAAAICGKGDFLAPRSQPPQVPPDAGESSLGILPVDPQDREAVRLEFRPTAGNVVKTKARIDRWQRDRDLLLAVVNAQALERPAGDGDVAVGRNPLGIDDVAESIVVGVVITEGVLLLWGRRAAWWVW